jgi:hypothetical protein
MVDITVRIVAQTVQWSASLSRWKLSPRILSFPPDLQTEIASAPKVEGVDLNCDRCEKSLAERSPRHGSPCKDHLD